jgi:two-component system, NtrC family, sensor kinase
MGVFDKIPACLTVCVLVMIFACLKRHTRCAHLTLWSVGWTLIFTHFLAQLLEPASGNARPLLLSLDLGALQVSAITFVVSVSAVAEDRLRSLLLFVLGAPTVAYSVLDAYAVHSRWPYIWCLLACAGSAVLFLSWEKRKSFFSMTAATLPCFLAGAWAVHFTLNGSFDAGVMVLLGVGFALPAVLIFKNFSPKSPALLTISGGFLCWSAVFFAPLLLGNFGPNLILPDTLRETPKLVVAFGMILAVVEYKSEAIIGMQRKARILNQQLERFSAISSRLLGSEAPEAICPEIASAITEFSNFPAVLIHLEDQEGTLRIAGSSGQSQLFLRTLQDRTRQCSACWIQSLCSEAQRIGKASFLLPPDALESFGDTESAADGKLPIFREASTEVLIPLCSAAGACIGSITLSAPSDMSHMMPELARIEALATELAAAVELKSLHSQLVWSEKLAAMGQLVAGVAHELNNPLTAIMGFGELMTDAATPVSSRDHLTRLLSETRRMKRITDNLLRFSRQSSWDSKVARLAPVVQEVLTLCEYYTRYSKVAVEIDIAPDLPALAINEDEIKQILLNLFNNSCDALHGFVGARQIDIRAYQDGGVAVIQVQDSGPGFANLDRALDPFYTTKPVGKGTGLGLSVCHRIAKRRGGDLTIENVNPHGGLVTLRVPLVEAKFLQSSALQVVSAHA